MRKELTNFVDQGVLAAVNELAGAELCQVEELVDEALSDLVARRRNGEMRGDITAEYSKRHALRGTLSRVGAMKSDSEDYAR